MGDVDPAGLFAARDAGVAVQLADGTLAELTYQVLGRAFNWVDWERARAILLEVVDSDEPILIGGRAGLHRAGIASRHAGMDDEIASDRAFANAGWALLAKSKSLAALESTEVPLPGQRKLVSLSADTVKDMHSRRQRAWAEEFESFREKFVALSPGLAEALPERHDSNEALDIYLDVSQGKADAGRTPSCPRPSQRLDAFLRVKALLRLRYIRLRERYNPTKHANDIFDCGLLKYLAFPAAVCTGDTRLIAAVDASRSWQAKWIVRPEQLKEPAVLAEIQQLNWPTQSLDDVS
jgi:hypothetical protein